MQTLTPDLCIIGAGSGGLSMAAGAAQLGLDVVLIEGHKMGGDCLNYGCIPSKALLSIAIKKSQQNDVSMKEIHKYVHNVINTIAPHDSVERFEGLGVFVISSYGTFVDHNTVEASNYRIKAKRFVIATGSTAMIPNIIGLDQVDYMTNETIFDLKELPKHLMVIGGGPIGCELSQAYAMLGAKVTLLVRGEILPKDDRDAALVVENNLKDSGVKIQYIKEIKEISQAKQITITVDEQKIRGTHLLIATGRKANLEKLNLNKANIKSNHKGIIVNTSLLTSNPLVYAIGDAAPFEKFTHIAGYQAGLLIRSLIFKLKARYENVNVPWVTYTKPELAHVGLNAHEAKELFPRVKIIKVAFESNDRARANGSTGGFIKVALKRNGEVLGVTIVGENAGELLAPWIVMIQNKLKIKALTSCIFPYPTMSELHKAVASEFYKPKIFNNKMRKLATRLFRWTTW